MKHQQNALVSSDAGVSCRRWGVAAVCLLAISAPLSALGASFSGDSTTIVRARKIEENRRVLPVYEYLNLSAADIGMQGLSFSVGAWGRLDLNNQSYDKGRNGDLQYGYLQYRGETANSSAKIGRVTVNEGIAAERIDGIQAGADLVKGFRASAFLGKPVESSPDSKSGSFIYGGRLSHRYESLYTLGFSGLQETVSGDSVREEIGIDLSVNPHSSVSFNGISVYSTLTDEAKETSANLSLGPFENVTINGDISHINYAGYFTPQITTNAFRFNTDALRPDEELMILGGTTTLDFSGKGSISVDYHNYNYEIAGSAYNVGGTAKLKVGATGLMGAAIHRMAGDRDRLKYTEYRLYAQHTCGAWRMTADLFDVHYKEPVNKVTNTYSAAVAASYTLSAATTVGADIDYFHSPDVSNGLALLAKVQVKF